MSANSEPAALQALLQTAAFAPIPNLGWLRVTGEDRTRWLNGMTTNNIATLTPGQGCYTFFLNAQGRIQADAYAFDQADSILLQTQKPQNLAELLDRFIIMDDVELAPEQNRAGLSLTGPQSASHLTTLGLTPPADLHLTTQTFASEPVILLSTHSPLIPAFELWSDPATLGLLTESLRHAGAREATPEALTQLRILAGIPLDGADIRDRDLPQETAQTRALHFSKGCYLGQEIVERIHSRGNVHRTFTGFVLTPNPETDTPAPGTILMAALAGVEKPVGELTSIARVGARTLALGYLRREALEIHQPLIYPNGSAAPHSLPFTP